MLKFLGDGILAIFPVETAGSRLESLAKELNQPLLCSAAFARSIDLPLTPLGRFPLKGLAEPQEVFAPLAVPDPHRATA